MARGKSKTSPRRLAAVDRQVRALQLRAQGMSFQQVAMAAGFNSRQAAHKSVRKALTRMTKALGDTELRLDALRVDCLFVPMYRAAMRGDVAAGSACLVLMQRRSHLLAYLSTFC